MASPGFEPNGSEGEEGNPNMGAGERKTSLPDLSKQVIRVLVSLVVYLTSVMKIGVAGVGLFLVRSGVEYSPGIEPLGSSYELS